ncbi:MAG: flavin reductase [Saprospiraceae bacterium]|nr:flavin reductase [Saprospiraceae bacterium]
MHFRQSTYRSFSSNRRVSDNTTKDTLHNVRVNKVCRQCRPIFHRTTNVFGIGEFPSEVSEFGKVGLTPEPSDTVAAPRVLESPVNMECKVKDIIELGEHGGAGHLIICEVTMIAVAESVIHDDRLDPHKLDLMGRMGRNYYVRASGDAVSEIYQSVTAIPLGFDGLPKSIRESKILTGNEIAALASLTKVPEISETSLTTDDIKNISEAEKHQMASELIAEGKVNDALYLLTV